MRERITAIVATLLVSAALLALPGCPSAADESANANDTGAGREVTLAAHVPAPARSDGLAAFDVVYAVLQHPRCMNCHPAGDRPLQSDLSVPHTMNVQRGPDDRGRPGMRCVTCHGRENPDAPHLPPGVDADWHVAPREMVFEGLSKAELARMLLDPKRSHMTRDQLLEHVSHDALVQWGWDPGPGRTPVPIPQAEFVAAFQTWIESDAPVPAPDVEDTP